MSNVVKSISDDVAVVLFKKMNEFYVEKTKTGEWDRDSFDECFNFMKDALGKMQENGHDLRKVKAGKFVDVLYSIYLAQGGIDACYAKHIKNVHKDSILKKDDYIAIVNLLVSLYSK